MSYTSKMKLADTLENLIKEEGISKITVSKVVSTSGLSRQTFYNNFQDIQDLLYWTHDAYTRNAIDTFWENEDFCQAFYTSTSIMREHKVFYQQLIRKEGSNSFQKSFMRQNTDLSKIRIQKVSGREITEKEEFLLELYWHGAAKMLVNWIFDGMKEEPEELGALFYEALPMPLRQYWPK